MKSWWLMLLVCCFVAGALTALPRPASAFCGFYVSGSSEGLYNKATRVVLMRDGTRTILSMSNDYDGPPKDFAMVVPVPVVLQKENVKTLPQAVFQHVESLTAPRLVEYWEQDPCAVNEQEESRSVKAIPAPTAMAQSAGGSGGRVRIEAQFSVGEYDVLVLSADESSALETWLRENKYNIPQGASEALAPYVREQWKFFVAKVDINKVSRRENGSVRLSPLRFHYDSAEFRLPVRLGLLNASDAQDLIVYVISPDGRYETANYPNVFVPTNLDVVDDVRTKFPSFYATLFDKTLEHAGGRAVVTEYAWATSSCDPCPVPSLSPEEIETLGGDVLNSSNNSFSPYSLVITRMHTRYSKAVLTEDLVFRKADAVVGGREHLMSGNHELEKGAQVSAGGYNNFQARYVIRHAWEGAIECENPVRNQWGPPPGKSRWDAPEPTMAKDVDVAPRGVVDLTKTIYTPVPELELKGFVPESVTRHKGRWIVIALVGTLAATTALVLFAARRNGGQRAS